MSKDSDVLENPSSKFCLLENIFKWKPILKEGNLYKYEYEPYERKKFCFFNFAIRLVKCYQVHKEDLNSALDILYDLETDGLDWIDTHNGGDLFHKIKKAYLHLVLASKLFLSEKDEETVSEILDQITPVDEMDDSNKSAIHAVRSAVLVLCSDEAIEKAIVYIQKALDLDKDNEQWLFLKGLYLYRIRKITKPPLDPPSYTERELFEKALEKDPQNVVFKLKMADLYLEISQNVLKKHEHEYASSKNFPPSKQIIDEIRSKIKTANEYYKEAVEKYPESTYVMFTCAKGFIKLPDSYRNIELARTLLTDGLKRNQKSINGHLTMAFLLEEYDGNIDKAMFHLGICQKLKSLDAELALINFHSKYKNAVNGICNLEDLLKKYNEKSQQAIIYSQMVSYYLFVRYDLINACHYAKKFYLLNVQSSCMEAHRSCFITYFEPFSLIDVLMDEVKYKTKMLHIPEIVRKICEQFENFMSFQNVPLLKSFPQNMRRKIFDGEPIIHLKPNDKAPFQKNNYTKPFERKCNEREFNNNKSQSNGTNYEKFPPRGKKYDSRDNQPGTKRNTDEEPRQNPQFVNRSPRTNNFPSNSPNKNSNIREKSPNLSPPPTKHHKNRPKKYSSDSSDSEDEKLVKMLLKSLKKSKSRKSDEKPKKSRHRKIYSSSSESENEIKALLEKFVRPGKSRHRKKEYDSSESDSSSSDHRGKYRQHSKKYYTCSDSDDSQSSKYSISTQRGRNRHNREFETKMDKSKHRDSSRSERRKARDRRH